MKTTHSHARAFLPARRKLVCVLLAALLCASLAPAAAAQTVKGRLVVIAVSRAGNKAIPNVSITVTSEAGGTTRTCRTNDEGVCSFGALEPDLYRIEARRDATAATADEVIFIRVGFGQRMTGYVRLDVPPSAAAAVTEKDLAVARLVVPPPPQGSLAEMTIQGQRGVNATARTLERFPNNDSRFSSLLNLQGGVFETGSDESDFVFNSQPPNQNVVRENGLATLPQELATTSFQDTGALIFDVKKRRSLKSYSSFGVSTSNTPADLGLGTGGQLLSDIRKGGKSFKGEVYEYFAHDALSARNFFDFADKPALRYNLFGISLSGPLHRKDDDIYPHVYAFFNYEGIRARSGNVIFEAAPRVSLRPDVSGALAPVFDAYRAGGATLVEGASTNPDFDILRLDSENTARKDAVTGRFDYQFDGLDSLSLIYLGSRTSETTPDGVTGRRLVTRHAASTGIFNYTRALTRTNDGENAKLLSQTIFGIIHDPTRVFARTPLTDPALSRSAFSIGGTVGHQGIHGRTAAFAVATPGGLLRGGSGFDGRELRLSPTQFTFVEQLNWEGENHHLTFGGEVRLIRTSLDQRFGTTYSFATLADFAANRAAVEHAGDLGSFLGPVGERKVAQEYYVGYFQDAWDISSNMRLSYGARYEYYTPLRESRDRAVVFDPDAGTLLPAGTPFYRSREDNVLPRVAFVWAPRRVSLPGDNPDNLSTSHTVISASFGMHVGPDVLDNILRPVTSDRVRVSNSAGSFPADTAGLEASFDTDPNRLFRPLALSRDYVSPARVSKFDLTLKRELLGRVINSDPFDADNDDTNVVRELFVELAYVGERSRGLLLRNFANRIVSVRTAADPTQPAIVKREFDGEAGGSPTTPFGEIEYLTTGGSSNYDALQVSLKGRASKFLRFFQGQYTFARNRGNSDGADVIGAGDPFDASYDFGYNASDVRHKLSFGAVVFLICNDIKPCNATRNRFFREVLGGWTLGVLGNFQTGTPIDVRVKRPDIVYVDAEGRVFNTPAAGRSALLNVPGGGSSVAAYRPDLLPNVNPFFGGFADRRFLNPAAFATPAPGVLGNLRRGDLRGPGVRLVDLSLRKELPLGPENSTRVLSFSVDVTNVFNFTNFRLRAATLPNMLGTDDSRNQLQPGQPFTVESAPEFGVLTRTYKRQQDLGSSRQVQLSVSLKF